MMKAIISCIYKIVFSFDYHSHAVNAAVNAHAGGVGFRLARIRDHLAALRGIDLALEGESSRGPQRGRKSSKKSDFTGVRTCAIRADCYQWRLHCLPGGDARNGYFDVFISPTIFESLYSGNQFMFVIVLVLMFEKSLSFPAVKRAIGLSLLLSYYPILYVWMVTKFERPNQQKEFALGLQFVHGLQTLPFVYAFIKPPSRATKRIIRELCFASIVFILLTILAVILAMNPKTAGVSHRIVYVILSWIIFCPLVVWRVLKAEPSIGEESDSEHVLCRTIFNGRMAERACLSKGLHVLIEMNRKFVIDFAYLELIRQLGVGSKSTVFQGTLKMKTHVAVKAYIPTSCSDNVVAAFSHEAAMCSVLNHPNIVKFHGMCVAPPTICLVFQLCQGSLADTLTNQARRRTAHPARQQLLIGIGLMLDAARAVAYLHSFSPPFVHCDIKPTSFLLDAECNVQLSDFGESRCVTNLEKRTLAPKAKIPILEDKQFALKTAIDSPMGTTESKIDSPWSLHMEKNSAEYTAPEIIEQGEQGVYGEAADVYSLAVTMWDILYPAGDKFPQTNGDHVKVIEEVLHGARPRLDNNTPLRLRGIIERSWHRDPGLRPSAKQIVAALEDVQEELCSRLVLDLMSDLIEYSSVVSEFSIGSAEVHHTFPGALLVDRMIDRRLVRCPAEAIRMGNALMDSSVLHHVNHSRSFENSATARYYFAFDASLPIHVESSSSSLSQNESSIPMLTRGSNGGHPRTSFSFVRTRSDTTCQCRQLGQRLISDKPSRFRRRNQFQTAPEPTVDVMTTALMMEEEPSYLNHYNDLDMVPGMAATMA
ncbi:Winged helix-turn-helix DNA-binding domain [Phytophthora cactorum]|nr:Winged helix-turn-helix DNA-binding domain [Phytophthora cactorum]